jgi:hypothetical protein
MRKHQEAKDRRKHPALEACRPDSDREALAPFGPSATQYAPAALGGHPHKKAVSSLPLGVAECGQILFHGFIPGAM